MDLGMGWGQINILAAHSVNYAKTWFFSDALFPMLVQDNTSQRKPVLWHILGCSCKSLVTNYFQQTAEDSGCWCISVKASNIWRGPFTCVVRYGMVACQQKVTIIKLPPHTTDLLQPLDVAVFKSLKDHWGDIVFQRFRMFRHKLTDWVCSCIVRWGSQSLLKRCNTWVDNGKPDLAATESESMEQETIGTQSKNSKDIIYILLSLYPKWKWFSISNIISG